ncbi:MAG: acyl-CoA thioesterase [Bacteroidales bacterium]
MEIFELELEVRDYECDFQGIVNNSVYLNYLEHARHKYLLEKGINFTKLHTEGIDLVVSRIEIDYKYSLTSGDKFVVRIKTRREGHLRMIFEQEAIKLPEGKTVVKANVIGVGVSNGRPMKIDDIPGFSSLL